MTAFAVLYVAFAQTGFRLELKGPDTILHVGNETVLIAGNRPDQVKLADGRTLIVPKRFDTKPIQLGQESQNIQARLEKWIEDDAIWGGRPVANQLRYMHKTAGGLLGSLADVLPLPDGNAIGVLNVTALGPSMQPVIEQVQVRVRTKPGLDIEWIRRLPIPETAVAREPIRQFSARGKSYIVLSDLRLLDGEKEGRVVAQLPKRTALNGIAADKYAVFLSEDGSATSLSLVNYTKRAVILPPVDGEPQWIFDRMFPDTAWILLERQVNSQPEKWAYDLESSKRFRVPLETSMLWKNYAIVFDDVGVKVWGISDGKKIADLPLPSR